MTPLRPTLSALLPRAQTCSPNRRISLDQHPRVRHLSWLRALAQRPGLKQVLCPKHIFTSLGRRIIASFSSREPSAALTSESDHFTSPAQRLIVGERAVRAVLAPARESASSFSFFSPSLFVEVAHPRSPHLRGENRSALSTLWNGSCCAVTLYSTSSWVSRNGFCNRFVLLKFMLGGARIRCPPAVSHLASLSVLHSFLLFSSSLPLAWAAPLLRAHRRPSLALEKAKNSSVQRRSAQLVALAQAHHHHQHRSLPVMATEVLSVAYGLRANNLHLYMYMICIRQASSICPGPAAWM